MSTMQSPVQLPSDDVILLSGTQKHSCDRDQASESDKGKARSLVNHLINAMHGYIYSVTLDCYTQYKSWIQLLAVAHWDVARPRYCQRSGSIFWLQALSSLTLTFLNNGGNCCRIYYLVSKSDPESNEPNIEQDIGIKGYKIKFRKAVMSHLVVPPWHDDTHIYGWIVFESPFSFFWLITMGALSGLRSAIRRSSTTTDNKEDAPMPEKIKKDPLDTESVVPPVNEESQPEQPSTDAQRGVQDVEAVTLTWSKPTLIAVFIKYVAPSYPSQVN